jgi:hypothetical protein
LKLSKASESARLLGSAGKIIQRILMIRKTSTKVTINTGEQRRAENKLLVNALKPETQKLMSGLSNIRARNLTISDSIQKGSSGRKDLAKRLKKTSKSQIKLQRTPDFKHY